MVGNESDEPVGGRRYRGDTTVAAAAFLSTCSGAGLMDGVGVDVGAGASVGGGREEEVKWGE